MSAPTHLQQAVHHLRAHIEDLQRVITAIGGGEVAGETSVVAIVPPAGLLPSANGSTPHVRRGKGKPRQEAKAVLRRRRGEKAAAPSKPGGRQPRALSQACRAYVLQTLSRHPTSMTFRELRAAVASALEAHKVTGLDLDNLLYAQNNAMKAKGWLKRIGGAWAITDEGRAEVVRLREAAKAEGARS